MSAMRLGLVLPHFGEHADADRLLAGARRAEMLGFDSLWVRDHLLLRPAGFESASATFFEALTVLSAVGAVTRAVQLGTGALVPFRHPVHTALIASTLTSLHGPRVVLGVGTGSGDHEFETVGLGGVPRGELLEKNVEIMRRLWAGPDVSWDDETFRFSGATLEPRPPGGSIPLWYCGSSPKAARVAAASYDGWLPGRIPLATMRDLIPKVMSGAAERGRVRPVIGMIPQTSIAATRAAARAGVNVDALLAAANRARYWRKPETGVFETLEDLDGLVLHGTPDDVLDQCLRLRDAGVDHVVFDCRMTFERWEEQMELLAAGVLPGLKAAVAVQ
jgi:alkanesulfonate monooxygenase SsuD/methylene tetrahydromethanopterin reductase-like flavin-dependent oxidoreductase (luciferase family)